MVGAIIVPIEGLLANCERSSNCQAVFVVDSSSGEMLVDVVHGWDYRGNVWGTMAREKKSCVLKNLSSKELANINEKKG